MRYILLVAAFLTLSVTPSHAQTGPAGYSFCSTEGGTCSFSGTMSVAFGAVSSWTYQTLTSPVKCAIQSNGGPFSDPDVGVVKACFTESLAGLAPTMLTASQTAGNYVISWTLDPSSAVVQSNGTMVATITVTLTPTTTAKIVQLSWTAPAESVTGYNVYRSTVNGSNYTKLTATPLTTTSYQDGSVVSGSSTTYYYVVTDVSGGVESAYSNQASAVIP